MIPNYSLQCDVPAFGGATPELRRYVPKLAMRSICYLILCIAVFPLLATASPDAGRVPIVLSPLVLGEDFHADCGTYVFIKNVDSGESPFLAWTSTPAQIRLNGQLMQLNIDREKWTSKRPHKSTLGDHGTIRLSASGVAISVAVRLTSVCPDESSSCESETFAGKMTIRANGSKRTFDIHGGQGC